MAQGLSTTDVKRAEQAPLEHLLRHLDAHNTWQRLGTKPLKEKKGKRQVSVTHVSCWLEVNQLLDCFMTSTNTHSVLQ